MSKKNERHFFRIRKTERGVYMIPSSRHDAEYLDGWPHDSLVEATVHKGRSRQRHRLYWAMLHVVCENHPLITAAESLHKMLLLDCGIVEMFITIDGEAQTIPSSTAFDAMSESDFNAYFKHAQARITEKVLPGLDLHRLLDEAKHRSDTEVRDAA